MATTLRRRLALAGLLLALMVWGRTLWEMRHLPPLGTDSLVYHLTIPAKWLHEGFLAPLDLPFHDGAAEHAPVLTQAIFHGMMRLTGDDSLTALVQPAFLLVLAALFYASARLLGAGKPAAF